MGSLLTENNPVRCHFNKNMRGIRAKVSAKILMRSDVECFCLELIITTWNDNMQRCKALHNDTISREYSIVIMMPSGYGALGTHISGPNFMELLKDIGHYL